MEYFRNNIALISYEGVTIDTESLWKKRGQLMVLVDEDQYITYPFSEDKFYPVTL